VLVSAIEHMSVLEPARALAERGFSVEIVAPGAGGAVAVEDIEARLRPDTRLVALMTANNETGVVQPVRAVASICRTRNIRLHTDAVAAAGKLALDVSDLGCDSMSLSAHKVYAPKGTGVLYLRRGVALRAFVRGCGQQRGRRSGTENTSGAAAFGQALELWQRGVLVDPLALARLRDRLWEGIRSSCPAVERNGAGEILANTLNVYFPGRRSRMLQEELGRRGMSVAVGASSSTGAPSHVLSAMGYTGERASSSLRFSLGLHTTHRAIDQLISELAEILATTSAAELRA
jgi:cysteine desulfurase